MIMRIGMALFFSWLMISCEKSAVYPHNSNSNKAKYVERESCTLDTDCYLVNTTTGTEAGCCSSSIDFSQDEWIAVNVKNSKYHRDTRPCYASCEIMKVPLDFQQIAKCINSLCQKVPLNQQTATPSSNTARNTNIVTNPSPSGNTATNTNVVTNPPPNESCSADDQCYLVNATTGQEPGCCSFQVDLSQSIWIAANVNSTKYPRISNPNLSCMAVDCAPLQTPYSFQQIAKCINSLCQKVPPGQPTGTPPPSNTVTDTNQDIIESCNIDTDCYLVDTTTGLGPSCCPGLIDFSQDKWIAVNVNSTKYPKPPLQHCAVTCVVLQVPQYFHQTAKCVNSICKKIPY